MHQPGTSSAVQPCAPACAVVGTLSLPPLPPPHPPPHICSERESYERRGDGPGYYHREEHYEGSDSGPGGYQHR
jgi:hypothetical protein